MTFSILIPTWNNLPYLKCCIDSIQRHSTYKHEVLVHINETNRATELFLEEAGIAYTSSPENIGICKALNLLAAKAEASYFMYMNDDMYCLPGWDQFVVEEIKRWDTESFMFSSTMIEPRDTGNAAAIFADFGTELSQFNEAGLLQKFEQLPHADWSGSSWPPNIVHRSMWEKLNGYNELFSPGMSSDDDFSMRMWMAGCRLFKGISKSRVYHFQCKSTGRIVKNNGRQQFRQLYGISQGMFNRYFLRKGKPFTGYLKGPQWYHMLYWVRKLFR